MRYAPLPPGDPQARALFTFAGVRLPLELPSALGWGAWSGERLIGIVIMEQVGSSGMIHGPVVLEGSDPIEVGAHLASALMESVRARGPSSLFARPQGLDRVWIRFGFVPAPESMLPEPLKGRPGTGLFLWDEHRRSSLRSDPSPPRS